MAVNFNEISMLESVGASSDPGMQEKAADKTAKKCAFEFKKLIKLVKGSKPTKKALSPRELDRQKDEYRGIRNSLEKALKENPFAVHTKEKIILKCQKELGKNGHLSFVRDMISRSIEKIITGRQTPNPSFREEDEEAPSGRDSVLSQELYGAAAASDSEFEHYEYVDAVRCLSSRASSARSGTPSPALFDRDDLRLRSTSSSALDSFSEISDEEEPVYFDLEPLYDQVNTSSPPPIYERVEHEVTASASLDDTLNS